MEQKLKPAEVQQIPPWSQYSIDFLLVRHAVFMNFISFNAPIKEEDLTPENVYQIICDIGEDYINRNKRGLTEVKTVLEVNSGTKAKV